MSRHELGALAAVLLACGGGDDGSPSDAALDAAPADDAAPDDGPRDASADGGGCVAPTGDPALDAYGGDARVAVEATGWFRIEKLCDRFWLVTPDGHPFWSSGVNNATPRGDAGRHTGVSAYADAVATLYADDGAWADAAVERLHTWGFTSAGSWSVTDLLAPRMPITPNLQLSGANWETGALADYFDPAFAADVRAKVAERVTPWRDEPNVIGWFLDNEMKWGPDWRGQQTLLQVYLALPAEAPGKQEAVALLLGELGSVEAANALLGTSFAGEDDMLAATDRWGELDAGTSEDEARLTTAFLEQAADQYFRTVIEAIHEVDDHHLVLGNREVSIMTRAEVYLAAARYVDALSINNYVFLEGVAELALEGSGGLDPADGFAALHALVDLPILVTEFGFRAADSGLPNTWPPIYPTYATQDERADAFAEYSRGMQAVPWVIGHHWFEWVDEPADGRFDGENNNWGLVNEQDEPYEVLTTRMAEVHREISSYLLVPAD